MDRHIYGGRRHSVSSYGLLEGGKCNAQEGKGKINKGHAMYCLVVAVMEEGGIRGELPLVSWRDGVEFGGFAARYDIHFTVIRSLQHIC